MNGRIPTFSAPNTDLAKHLLENRATNLVNIGGKNYSVTRHGNDVKLGHTSHNFGAWLRRVFIEKRVSSAEKYTSELRLLTTRFKQQREKELFAQKEAIATATSDITQRLGVLDSKKSLICSELVNLRKKLKEPLWKEVISLCQRENELTTRYSSEAKQNSAIESLNSKLGIGSANKSSLQQNVDDVLAIDGQLDEIIRNYDNALKNSDPNTQNQLRGRVKNLANDLWSLYSQPKKLGYNQLSQRLAEEVQLSADLRSNQSFLVDIQRIGTQFQQLCRKVAKFNKENFKPWHVTVDQKAWAADYSDLDKLIKSGTSTLAAINQMTAKLRDHASSLEKRFEQAETDVRVENQRKVEQRNQIGQVRDNITGIDNRSGINPLLERLSKLGIQTTNEREEIAKIIYDLTCLEQTIKVSVVSDDEFKKQTTQLEQRVENVNSSVNALVVQNRLKLALESLDMTGLTSLASFKSENEFAQILSEKFRQQLTDTLWPEKEKLIKEAAKLSAQTRYALQNETSSYSLNREMDRINGQVKKLQEKIKAFQQTADIDQQTCIAFLNRDEITYFNEYMNHEGLRNEIRSFWISHGVKFAYEFFEKKSVQEIHLFKFEETRALLLDCAAALSYYETEQKNPESVFARTWAADHTVLKNSLINSASTTQELEDLLTKFDDTKTSLKKCLEQRDQILSDYELTKKNNEANLFVYFGREDYLALKNILSKPDSTLQDMEKLVGQLKSKKATATDWDKVCGAFNTSNPNSMLMKVCNEQFKSLQTALAEKKATWERFGGEVEILKGNVNELARYQVKINMDSNEPALAEQLLYMQLNHKTAMHNLEKQKSLSK